MLNLRDLGQSFWGHVSCWWSWRFILRPWKGILVVMCGISGVIEGHFGVTYVNFGVMEGHLKITESHFGCPVGQKCIEGERLLV